VAAPDQLANWVDTVRLSLHVTAATVWVGGQVVVGGLIPTVRTFGGDATVKVARAFARVAWPAFLVLIATGVWNVIAMGNGHGDHDWQTVLSVKIAVVVVAAAAVGVHQRATTARARGVAGGLGLLCSLGAVVLGVLLAG
jgi:putative copper export protein